MYIHVCVCVLNIHICQTHWSKFLVLKFNIIYIHISHICMHTHTNTKGHTDQARARHARNASHDSHASIVSLALALASNTLLLYSDAHLKHLLLISGITILPHVDVAVPACPWLHALVECVKCSHIHTHIHELQVQGACPRRKRVVEDEADACMHFFLLQGAI